MPNLLSGELLAADVAREPVVNLGSAGREKSIIVFSTTWSPIQRLNPGALLYLNKQLEEKEVKKLIAK